MNKTIRSLMAIIFAVTLCAGLLTGCDSRPASIPLPAAFGQRPPGLLLMAEALMLPGKGHGIYHICHVLHIPLSMEYDDGGDVPADSVFSVPKITLSFSSIYPFKNKKDV